MSYNINPVAFSTAFTVPLAVSQKLKIASENQIKVILYVLANLSEGIDAQKISEKLGISLSETEDSLNYWVQNGVLTGQAPSFAVPEKENERVVLKSARPSRGDVARRGLEDKALAMLLSEAQLKFGRNLKSNEASGLVWIYDDLGLNVSVILLLLQYALSENRLNITFLEKTAAKWAEMGISDVTGAEKFITDEANKKLAWQVVERAFGIEKRKPSAKETELADLWLCSWGFNEEILVLAYEECVNQKSKFIMSYVAKILENWHKSGVKTADDVKKEETKKEKPKKAKSFAGYDIELYKQKLKADD